MARGYKQVMVRVSADTRDRLKAILEKRIEDRSREHRRRGGFMYGDKSAYTMDDVVRELLDAAKA